ncbi:MAG: hypothetical protein COW73_09865 [Nitrospirae bacterium CG18_big_fil_WC_8_21_14_2_50_70_55]|nr:hypothetical protein [Deltaproteobacteria bacterium]PIQ03837.1 MAG: hypothetical protein COW73_09865 [Nitrospirae bacterium CG18_big_fil_WC_8_21_14_2_50_70_55]PIU80194.1 MAG: hypothetical protein COS73_00895 [Nitrospirae bacterium CG06_land_8_20_14_3_00_70_43]PJB95601.1 MAG: hypothetical protein CO080_07025 [Nitrospirae bacterium CG_4_9_14_0_8_um_filter_70_14]HBB40973.1 hypothetical protein [Pseudomonadota bacterium]
MRQATVLLLVLLLPAAVTADPATPLRAVVWEDAANQASLQLTGRVMADYRTYDHDGVADTFTFRRVRFGFDGRALGWLRLRVEIETAAKAELSDGFADLILHPALTVRAGQFKLPFSFDELTSSTFFDLQERSMFTALAPNRDRGVEVLGAPLAWLTYELALANGSGVNVDEKEATEDGKDWAARLVLHPQGTVAGRPAVGHLGLAATAGDQPAGDAFAARTAARSLRFLSLTSTADFRRTRIGAEAAMAVGPWKLQSEWARQSLAGDDLDVSVDAAYLTMSWLITGEPFAAAYSPDGFGRIRPNRTFAPGRWGGAVEVSARIGRLEGRDLAQAAGQSRDASEAAVGVVWILHPNVRVVASTFHTEFDEPVAVGSGSVNHEDGVATRLQVDL